MEPGSCLKTSAMVTTTVEDPISTSLWQMITAIQVVLRDIGEDVEREGLLKTPLRVASAFQEAVSGYQLSAKEIVGTALFSEAGAGGCSGWGGGSGGIVVVRDIDLFALCESCLLPFRLRCHVAYIPSGGRVVGLSKLPRVAEIFAKRLQNPQKFADEVVQALDGSFGPLGVGLMLESWHLQWPDLFERDGVSVTEERLGFGWVPVSVYAGKGQFEDLQSSLWDEFLRILELEGVRPSLETRDGQWGKRKSCPFLLHDRHGVSSLEISPDDRQNGSSGVNLLLRCAGMTMSPLFASAAIVAAGMESLLRAVGEDPSKEDLRSTALRFLNWILCATQGSRESISNGEDHCLHGSVKGTTIQSNGKAFVNCSNGAMNDNGLNVTSVNGFIIFGNGGDSLIDGSSAWSNRSSRLSHGALSNGANYPTDELNQYGNGTISSCTLSNGNRVLKQDGISEVDNHTEGLLCVELDISFSSLCEHHLLPFFGIVHLGYIRGNGDRRIDRPLVLKIVRMYSRRLQVQERFTREIAEAVVSFAGLQGAMVLAEASHTCIMSRGVRKLSSSTATVATIGKFSSDDAMRGAFLKRISRKGGTNKLN